MPAAPAVPVAHNRFVAAFDDPARIRDALDRLWNLEKESHSGILLRLFAVE